MTIIVPLNINTSQQSAGPEIGRTSRGDPCGRPEESIHDLLETASLYLHIPFCHTRCHYCDFNTYAGILPLREPYVRALLTEIVLMGQFAQLAERKARRSRTIFFGGGTPSLLSVDQVRRILHACTTCF